MSIPNLYVLDHLSSRLGMGSWRPSLWNKKKHLSYKVNIMAVDGLVMKEAMA